MLAAKNEFTADLLLHVLLKEPDLPLFLGFYSSEVYTFGLGDQDYSVKMHEPPDPCYKRQPIYLRFYDHHSVVLKNNIVFPKATKRWEKITHFVIFDEDKNGNALLIKPIGTVSTVEAGEIANISVNDFILYVGTNGLK